MRKIFAGALAALALLGGAAAPASADAQATTHTWYLQMDGCNPVGSRPEYLLIKPAGHRYLSEEPANTNPEAQTYNFDFTVATPVAGLPLLPILGVRGDF